MKLISRAALKPKSARPKECRAPYNISGTPFSKDPAFAAAYAGLADSLSNLSTYEDPPPAEVIPQPNRGAEALELDDRLAKRTPRWRRFAFTTWNGTEWNPNSNGPLRLNPGYAPALHRYALSLAALGRKEESITEIKLAREIDPALVDYQCKTSAGVTTWRATLTGRLRREKLPCGLTQASESRTDIWARLISRGNNFAEAIAELRTFVSLAPGEAF